MPAVYIVAFKSDEACPQRYNFTDKVPMSSMYNRDVFVSERYNMGTSMPASRARCRHFASYTKRDSKRVNGNTDFSRLLVRRRSRSGCLYFLLKRSLTTTGFRESPTRNEER